MPRSQKIDLEAERQTLMGMLQEADLSEALVRKLRLDLTSKKALHPPMPTMTPEQVVARLRQQEANPSKGIPHEEVLKIIASW